MDVQLKELIDKIKEEGVGKADATANQIIEDANQKASEIVSKAKKESEEIISSARAEAAQLENSGKEALKQASRDLILNIKGSLTSLFDTIVKNKVSDSLPEDVIKEIIPTVIKGWFEKGQGGDIEVLLSDADKKKLEEALLGGLAAELKNGVTIKPHPTIKAGFRIAEKDGDSYYDFTDEGIAENLIQHVNPVLAEIIQSAAGKEN